MKNLASLLLFVCCAIGAAARPSSAQLQTDQDGKISVAVVGYLDDHRGNIGEKVADFVSSRLYATGRFETYERSRLQTLMDEQKLQTLFGDPRKAQALGKVFNVRYLIYGKVMSAGGGVDRSVDKKGRVSYSASASVTVKNSVVEVASGKLIKDVVTDANSSAYSSNGEPAIEPLLVEASERAANKFVKTLVPEAKGIVVAKLEGGQVLINLGSKHGVGQDTDIHFMRDVPLKDADGNIIRIQSKPCVPEGKGAGDFCIGRPVTINEEDSILDVGYNSRGGFLKSAKFKASKEHYDAVNKGDAIQLKPRPENIQ